MTDDGPPDGGVLRLYGPGESGDLDPARAGGAPARQITRLCTRQLFGYAPVADPADWRIAAPVPDLAADVPSTYNAGMSASHKVYTVTLRSGVRWDSSPPREVTAGDFVRAFKRLCSPVPGMAGAAYFAGTIRGFTEYRRACAAAFPGGATAAELAEFHRSTELPGVFAVDDDVLVFELERPDPEFLHLLALPAASPVPVEYEAFVPGDGTAPRHLRSTGPYRVVPAPPGTTLRLERNPVWRPETDPLRSAHVDAVEVTAAPATAGALRRVIGAGRADLPWGLSVPDLSADPRGDRYVRDEVLDPYLVFNLAASPGLDAPELRRRIAAAIDKRALLRIHRDLGLDPSVRVAHSLLGPADGRAEPADVPVAGSPAPPKELVLIHSDAGAHPAMARSVAADLAGAGIAVRVEARPFAAYRRIVAETGGWDLALAAWAPEWPDDRGRATVEPLLRGGPVPGVANHGRYLDPGLDRAMDEAIGVTDPDRARAAWREIDRRAMADAPVVPLLAVARTVPRAAGDRVRGAVAMPVQDHAPDLAAVRLDLTLPERPPAIPVARSVPAPGRYLCGLTHDGRYLWHSDQEAGKLFAVHPAHGEMVREVSNPRVRADLAFHDGLLHQIGGRPKRLVLIDPETGREVGEKPVDPPSGRVTGVEAAPEGLWLCLRAPSVAQLRDPRTMEVLREFPIEGEPAGLTWAGGRVLYAEFETGVLRAVDDTTGEPVAEVTLEGHPTGLTWDGYQLWYCDFEARRLKSVRLAEVLRHPPARRRGGG